MFLILKSFCIYKKEGSYKPKGSNIIEKIHNLLYIAGLDVKLSKYKIFYSIIYLIVLGVFIDKYRYATIALIIVTAVVLNEIKKIFSLDKWSIMIIIIVFSIANVLTPELLTGSVLAFLLCFALVDTENLSSKLSDKKYFSERNIREINERQLEFKMYIMLTIIILCIIFNLFSYFGVYDFIAKSNNKFLASLFKGEINLIAVVLVIFAIKEFFRKRKGLLLEVVKTKIYKNEISDAKKRSLKL
ncbi:hypothetical protein [Gemella massiliensis]|uniref:hypothetical protein n=1 Tax=Gemella massiliensis TaxID=1909670 RepID=UPI00092FFE13|nr:hypothetical protein [Gemella massiliensis]